MGKRRRVKVNRKIKGEEERHQSAERKKKG